MAICANIHTDSIGNIIVEMKGSLDYEFSIPLHNELTRIADTNPRSVITLDFNAVQFVGASGIGQFVQTLNQINSSWHRMKLTNVKSEYIRVFKLYNMLYLEELTKIEEGVEQRLEKFNSLRKNYRI